MLNRLASCGVGCSRVCSFRVILKITEYSFPKYSYNKKITQDRERDVSITIQLCHGKADCLNTMPLLSVGIITTTIGFHIDHEILFSTVLNFVFQFSCTINMFIIGVQGSGSQPMGRVPLFGPEGTFGRSRRRARKQPVFTVS